MAVTSIERIFRAEQPPFIATLNAGLLALADSDGAQATRHLFTHTAVLPNGTQVLHRPTPNPRRTADKLRHHPSIRALTAHPAGTVAPGTWLALTFADHLRQVRQRPPGAFLVSPHAELDGLPDDIRLVHFVTVRGNEDLDVTLWEWLPRSEAEQWFGGPLPAIDDLQQRWPAVLRLRRAARTGRLPDTDDGRRLAEALRGRYFSGRFVLQHHDLIARLLDDPTTERDCP